MYPCTESDLWGAVGSNIVLYLTQGDLTYMRPYIAQCVAHGMQVAPSFVSDHIPDHWGV